MSGEEFITISINHTLDEILGRLEDFAVDQLPFAQAKALVDTADEAREEMREQLPRKFTIRSGSKPWASRALIYDPGYIPEKARKTIQQNIKNGQNGEISIVSNDEVLGRLLTDGGVKKHRGMQTRDGKRHEREFGVPIIGGGRRTKMTKLTPKNNFDAILKKERSLVITADNGKDLLVTYPKKYRKGIPKKMQHKAMFHVRPEVNIKPWWDARAVLGVAMDKWLPSRFEAACRIAMKTKWG